MQIGYPFRIDSAGHTALAGREAHIRAMIEQVLFTVPGERVNRPDFGTGLRQYLFSAENDETLTAVQFLVEGALQQWLGDLIEVYGVEVHSEDSTMTVAVSYQVRATNRAAVAEFRV
jgi:phage baseplate assembly protein W